MFFPVDYLPKKKSQYEKFANLFMPLCKNIRDILFDDHLTCQDSRKLVSVMAGYIFFLSCRSLLVVLSDRLTGLSKSEIELHSFVSSTVKK